MLFITGMLITSLKLNDTSGNRSLDFLIISREKLNQHSHYCFLFIRILGDWSRTVATLPTPWTQLLVWNIRKVIDIRTALLFKPLIHCFSLFDSAQQEYDQRERDFVSFSRFLVILNKLLNTELKLYQIRRSNALLFSPPGFRIFCILKTNKHC